MTVHDVAARSGVSIATVSRTLRSPHRVSEETRDRVLAAVQDLGYQPNRAARGLRGGRTGVIALVVPDIENPYFSALTKGAQASARERGYGLVVVDTTERADVEAAEIQAVGPQIDGIILASSRLPDDQLAQTAAATTCVLVNRYDTTDGSLTPTVTIDEAVGAHAAIAHLYELGHRRLLYVGGPDRAWSQARRSKAIREAVASYPDLALEELSGFSPDAQGGRNAADAARAGGAQAVIAYNDLVALGLLARWSETGIRVPDDVSLVGFDNTYVAELSFPPLTSVGADLREFGETAVTLLLERIDAPEGAAERLRADPDAVEQLHREVPPRLVVRSSTAAPAR
ncbi:LacI family DNA-binding transcriptional regulator [Protaetiibacter larvae]|uniref:LacI family DNA-binding transcriptional regulator n=1 Tax=Protaetiibacter larvae TaxID=2592654 RepID=UPI001FEA1A6A|nr:LacI family DNA-binding transcriptional regulator [Protaetiibacter larvae]